MSDDKRPGGAAMKWVDPDRRAPENAFDNNDEYSGQQYSREREAAQGEADRAGDTPHARTSPEPPPPEDPDSFGAP
jgi:hypothetical protein